MRMPITSRREIQRLVRRSTVGVLVCALLVAYVVATGSAAIVPAASLLLLSGACFAMLLVFSWRLYHSHFSWLVWALPGTALITVVFFAFVVPPVRDGFVSPPFALLVLWAFAGGGFFGTLVILRKRIHLWLLTDGP